MRSTELIITLERIEIKQKENSERPDVDIAEVICSVFTKKCDGANGSALLVTTSQRYAHNLVFCGTIKKIGNYLHLWSWKSVTHLAGEKAPGMALLQKEGKSACGRTHLHRLTYQPQTLW